MTKGIVLACCRVCYGIKCTIEFYTHRLPEYNEIPCVWNSYDVFSLLHTYVSIIYIKSTRQSNMRGIAQGLRHWARVMLPFFPLRCTCGYFVILLD